MVVGRLRLGSVALALVTVALAAGCGSGGGNRDAEVYRHELTPALLRLDSVAAEAQAAIDAFETGTSSFLAAHRSMTGAGLRLAVVQRLMVAVTPPDRYLSAHQGLTRSAGLLRVAISTYDRYLQQFVFAVAAFRQSHRGEFEATRATHTYQEYALRMRGFEALARAAHESAPDAILFPADLLSYSPPNTVVYVTRRGVFASARPSS
jgi:hypothetical protein